MFKIATFNVENLDDQHDPKKPPLNVRAPILRAAMQRLEANVLCLQEVNGQETETHTSNDPDRSLSALREVIRTTRYENYHVTHTQTSNTAYNERNLVILSEHPFVGETQQLRNELIGKLLYRRITAKPVEEDAKEVRWERPILHSVVGLPSGERLHMVNLHLKSRLATNIPGQKVDFAWQSAAAWAEGYFMSSMKRVGQALEVRLLVDQIFEEEPRAKIVVCGDFNAEPGEVPVAAICGEVENTENPKLHSRVLVPCSRAIPESVRYTHIHHGQGNLLDHILISRGLLGNYRGAQIHNEDLHDESRPFASDLKFPESDHAAFVASFELA